jgi:charged multivesicular body protein 5
MFNFFGRKQNAAPPQQPHFQPVDLNATSHGISNRKNDTQLKLGQVEKELKGALVEYRQARTPQQKAQAKSKAMRLLKKKKLYQAHVNNLENTQMAVESAAMDVDIMKDNMAIMQTMKSTVQMQKDMMHAMGGIDSMYDVMDDMQEIKEQQEEFNDEMQRNFDIDVDDADLNDEIDELDYQMRMEMDNQGMQVPMGGEVNPQIGNNLNAEEAALEAELK